MNVGMKIIGIKRVIQTNFAYFGIIHYCGNPFALTGERKWANNQKEISCIPTGEYVCQRILSSKFGETFEVMSVVGRDHILFHCGNIPEQDSHGCILLGEQFGILSDKTAILSSTAGFKEFIDILIGENQFKLIVEESNGWVV